MPFMAPYGGNKPLFGTNPIAFAWPRPGRNPVVVDMATAAMALGEVQIAAREGHPVPPGTGLDASGKPTTDPNEIVKGMLLHSRMSSGSKEPTDINAMAEEYLRLSYHGFRAKDGSNNAAGLNVRFADGRQAFVNGFEPGLDRRSVSSEDAAAAAAANGDKKY